MQDKNTSINNIQGDDESFGLDIKKAVGKFIDYWKFFLISVLIALAAAYCYMKYAVPVYKVKASLMIQDPDKGGNLFNSTSSALSDLGDLFGTKSSVDNEAEILQTTDLTMKVGKDLRLYTTVLRVNGITNAALYAYNIPFDINLLTPVDSIRGTALRVKYINTGNRKALHVTEKTDNGKFQYVVDFDKPFRTGAGDSLIIGDRMLKGADAVEYIISLRPILSVAHELSNLVSIDIPNKQVSTIDLMLKTTNKTKGVDILNTLISEYIHGNINQKNAFADSTIDFIDNRIAIVNQELTGIEKKVQAFKETNKIADISEQARAVIDNQSSSQKDLNQAEVQKQIAENAIKYLEDEHNNRRPVPSLLASPDPTFLVLLDKYNTLQVEADKMAMGSTSANPMLVNLNEQINNLRKDLLTNLRNQLSAINVGVARLEAQSGKVNSFIQNAPSQEREFLGLSREQDIKQALFIYLLQKKEEVAVTKASNISSCVVIDSPKADEFPSSPVKSVVFLIAILAAIGIPYGILLIMDALNNKVTDERDLAHTGVTVIGEIGHNPAPSSLLFVDKPRSVLAEQFRTLRTNLQFALGETHHPIVMITSSTSGEGKSFISINLAMAHASIGKKVLLMELDLRKPRIAKQLSIDGAVGFSSYIISPLEVEQIIYPTEVNSMLDLIPSGPIPPNPAELLAHPKTALLLERLRSMYDIIIIDSAPIGLVTDAQLLAKYVDTTIYIVRQGYTYKHQTHIIGNLLESGKMSRLYAVINDRHAKASTRYGYDSSYSSAYGYGYGYGYGSGNGNGYGYMEAENKSWWKKILKTQK